MGLLYLIILLIVAVLPVSVFFVNPIVVLLFYSLQIFLLFYGLLFSIVKRKNIYFSKLWIAFFASILLSISGLIFFSQNISSGTAFSYVSGLIVALNASLFFANLKCIKTEEISSFIAFFNWFILLCTVIGVLQYFGYATFEAARNKYWVTVNAINIPLNRSTSIFIEPSGWAILFAIYFLLIFRSGLNIFNAGIVLISLFLSLSTTGFILVFSTFIFWGLYKIIHKITIRKIFLSVSICCVAIFFTVSLVEPFIDKLISSDKDFRNLAPIATVSSLFSDRALGAVWGNGVFSLSAFIKSLGLEETAQTTHNLLVDVFFELGLFGLIIILIIALKPIRHKRLFIPLVILFLSQMGYRSYLLPFVVFIFYICFSNDRKSDVEENNLSAI